jgi:hypothetical protein
VTPAAITDPSGRAARPLNCPVSRTCTFRRKRHLVLAWVRDENLVVFKIDDRDRVRDRVLDLASTDPRVVAGAALGSLAHDQGDQWSDLDLMFVVADDVPLTTVLEDWSKTVVRQFDAIPLFDLPSGPIIYRVFLFRSGRANATSRVTRPPRDTPTSPAGPNSSRSSSSTTSRAF